MKTVNFKIIPVLFIIPFLPMNTGCTTTDGGSGGWVVIDGPSETSGPQHKTPSDNAKGMDVAAMNHVRSAYRFLQKDKPDHAFKELEKARAKMSHNYWFHYYMGGAFHLKTMYGDAAKSWDRAYQYTKDPQLRSRIMTCRSFAEYRMSSQDKSVGFLREAINLDAKNESAREFLDDLSMVQADEQDRQTASRAKNDKPAKDKVNKSTGKTAKQGKKIADKEQFKTYFLVEMPENGS